MKAPIWAKTSEYGVGSLKRAYCLRVCTLRSGWKYDIGAMTWDKKLKMLWNHMTNSRKAVPLESKTDEMK
eukprot:14908593-Ditylum_brightwellii.AAC.1